MTFLTVLIKFNAFNMERFFLLIISIIATGSVSGQLFKNLNFQQTCDTSKTGFCFWDQSWGAKKSCIPAQSGNNLYLSISGAKENSVGFVEQTVLLKKNKGL